MTDVVVVDYGMGNLHSVSKALESVSTSENIIISSEIEKKNLTKEQFNLTRILINLVESNMMSKTGFK